MWIRTLTRGGVCPGNGPCPPSPTCGEPSRCAEIQPQSQQQDATVEGDKRVRCQAVWGHRCCSTPVSPPHQPWPPSKPGPILPVHTAPKGCQTASRTTMSLGHPVFHHCPPDKLGLSGHSGSPTPRPLSQGCSLLTNQHGLSRACLQKPPARPHPRPPLSQPCLHLVPSPLAAPGPHATRVPSASPTPHR